MNLINDISKRFEERYRYTQTPWHTSKADQEDVKKFVEIVKDFCGENPCVLDIGCGRGWATNYFGGKGFHVLGIDSSQTAIEQAKKDYVLPNCKFILGNALSYHYDLKFDAIFDRGFFHHIPEESWGLYFRLLDNNLKPKGIYYLTVFSDLSVKKGFDPRKEGRMWNKVKDGNYWTYDHFFNDSLIEELFCSTFDLLWRMKDKQREENGSLLYHYIFQKK